MAQEAAAFTLLASVGLPVPVILAGPSREVEGEPRCCLVVTELPGMNLQKISMLPPASGGLGNRHPNHRHHYPHLFLAQSSPHVATGHATAVLGSALDRLLDSSAACQASPLAVPLFPTLSLEDELRQVDDSP